MRLLLSLFTILGFLNVLTAQKTIDQALQKYNKNSVPYIDTEVLKNEEGVFLIDSREKYEYDVSHLKNAFWSGYETFSIDSVLMAVPDKQTPVVVYCSIGVRSEHIAEKLVKAGYANVRNLYGGIFKWKTEGNEVYGPNDMPTEKVHAYDKQWGKLLSNAKKVYGTKTTTN